MVVSMSEKEFSRLSVLMDAQAGRLRIDDAAQLLKLKRRCHLAVLVEDPIHGPDRAMIEALVQQFGVDLRRGLVDEAGFAQQIEDGRPLGRGQGSGGTRARTDRRGRAPSSLSD